MDNRNDLKKSRHTVSYHVTTHLILVQDTKVSIMR